jgi:hypothetical protein
MQCTQHSIAQGLGTTHSSTSLHLRCTPQYVARSRLLYPLSAAACCPRLLAIRLELKKRRSIYHRRSSRVQFGANIARSIRPCVHHSVARPRSTAGLPQCFPSGNALHVRCAPHAGAWRQTWLLLLVSVDCRQ